MLRRITIFTLLVALLACPDVAMAKKKKKKEKDKDKKTSVFIERQQEEVDLPITNEFEQINGEWNVVELKNNLVSLTSERVYLNFDVIGKMIYGNTGTNTLNAAYRLDGNKLKIRGLVTTKKVSNYSSDLQIERELCDVLDDEPSLALVKVGDIEYMELKDRRRNVVAKLRRQNLDFMNGPWLVKTLNGTDIIDRDIKLVNDIDMLTVNITSGCNIINGVITIDPYKEFAIEYEDLKSTNYQCPNIDTETRLLIALEEAQFCHKRNGTEVELLTTERDEMGKSVNKTLVVLEKVDF